MLAWLNFIVLTVTLIVLCIYAWDTKKMQRVNTKQMQLGIKPLISIETRDKGNTYWVLVKNIGNGTAINIEFDLMKLDELSGVTYWFPFIQSLKAGEEREIQVLSYIGDELADNSWTAHLKSAYANRVLFLKMSYENVDFEKSSQVFEFGLGERRIKMLP